MTTTTETPTRDAYEQTLAEAQARLAGPITAQSARYTDRWIETQRRTAEQCSVPVRAQVLRDTADAAAAIQFRRGRTPSGWEMALDEEQGRLALISAGLSPRQTDAINWFPL